MSYGWERIIGRGEERFVANNLEFEKQAHPDHSKQRWPKVKAQNGTGRSGDARQMGNALHATFTVTSLYCVCEIVKHCESLFVSK